MNLGKGALQGRWKFRQAELPVLGDTASFLLGLAEQSSPAEVRAPGAGKRAEREGETANKDVIRAYGGAMKPRKL